MKYITLPTLAVMALAACEPTDPTPAKPVTPLPTDVCNAAQLQDLVGQPRSSIDEKRFKTSTVRYIKPNSAVTLDYSEQRLNIVLDENGAVVRVLCG